MTLFQYDISARIQAKVDPLVKKVSERYYFLMTTRRPTMSERVVAELIARLGRVGHGDSFKAGLTPAQWNALRYCARANRFSRTLSAFAEFHGTTRGTASQTTASLVAQGYLVPTRSQTDRRRVRLDLTDKARVVLANDPIEALVLAARALPSNARSRVADALGQMLAHVCRESGKRPFGCCMSCKHLQGDGCRRDSKPPYVCGRVGEPLTKAELQQLCIDFTARRHSAANH
jgi:DNA-binding MarR family transcriptional regulator